mgnify:CR=1 FL=1
MLAGDPGFFLRHAWVIALLPFLSGVLTLTLGKGVDFPQRLASSRLVLPPAGDQQLFQPDRRGWAGRARPDVASDRCPREPRGPEPTSRPRLTYVSSNWGCTSACASYPPISASR